MKAKTRLKDSYAKHKSKKKKIFFTPIFKHLYGIYMLNQSKVIKLISSLLDCKMQSL